MTLNWIASILLVGCFYEAAKMTVYGFRKSTDIASRAFCGFFGFVFAVGCLVAAVVLMGTREPVPMNSEGAWSIMGVYAALVIINRSLASNKIWGILKQSKMAGAAPAPVLQAPKASGPFALSTAGCLLYGVLGIVALIAMGIGMMALIIAAG